MSMNRNDEGEVATNEAAPAQPPYDASGGASEPVDSIELSGPVHAGTSADVTVATHRDDPMPHSDERPLPSFTALETPPDPGELEAARNAYRGVRVRLHLAVAIAMAAVLSFFAFVLLTTSRAEVQLAGQTTLTRDEVLLISGIVAGVAGLLATLYLAGNLPELVERKALAAARRARKRFKLRQQVLSESPGR
jgi:hypothetical protein